VLQFNKWVFIIIMVIGQTELTLHAQGRTDINNNKNTYLFVFIFMCI